MNLQLPSHLIPADPRFGSGPSRIRRSQVDAVAFSPLLGTSHRQAPVKNLVAEIRQGLRDLYRLPDGWEVVMGNGGATAFWAMATAGLVRRRAAHAVFGEFGGKFAAETSTAPHLSPSFLHEAPTGQVAILPEVSGWDDVDVIAYPHHETSTGALSPLYGSGSKEILTLVDATSIAGGMDVDVSNVDVYYFSPQKCFGSDGGLWVALMSPAALERVAQLKGATDRWVPQFLSLPAAVSNSVKDQTLNTPALATLILLNDQIQWMLAEGGLASMEARSRAASQILYTWAEHTGHARPFISNEEWRSHVVVTLDFDSTIDAATLRKALRAGGVIDVDPYRGIGGNQMRVATFPNTDVSDVEALVSCLDYLIENGE